MEVHKGIIILFCYQGYGKCKINYPEDLYALELEVCTAQSTLWQILQVMFICPSFQLPKWYDILICR